MNALERFTPRYIWRRRIETWGLDTGEPEEQLLPWICDPDKVSIDIGAAAGSYAVRLLLYSSRVIAFEPHPASAEELRRLFRHTPIVSVEQVALSDEAGSVELRSPVERPMLSTIEGTNMLAESQPRLVNILAVNRERLDAYNLTQVGFIKIDVEGHESSVLAGASRTIERERPALLIEIEARHNPGSMAHNSAFLANRDYSGYFLLGNELVGLEQFSAEIHQNPANIVLGRRTGTYVNNFLFLPRERNNIVLPRFGTQSWSKPSKSGIARRAH